MSGKIITLSKTLANQIAAGEVVERPFSVVKELVENSLDSGATNIRVEITGGGIESIIISDNGSGISRDDLALVTRKYTTSKITSLDDLYNVMTFGFRGEALASISSVCKFQIISKQVSDDFGGSLEIIDGEEGEVEDFPCETGTQIIVKDLFYNTPARLNYLKKPRTEYNHIIEFLHQVALSYPKIGLEFISDEKQIFFYKHSENLENRIYAIYGKEFFENLLPLSCEIGGITLSGFISDPKVSFGSNKKQSLFVNKRSIKSPLIFRAIQNAYNRFIPHSQHSAYVLHIDLDPREVDVNVHPRKLEVRFANESTLFRGIYSSIESKLQQVSLVGSSALQSSDENSGENTSEKFSITFQEPENQKQYYTGSGTKFKSYSPYKNTDSHPSQGTITDAMNFSSRIMESPSSSYQSSQRGLGETQPSTSGDLNITPLGKIIGQMHNSYIIVETEGGMKILDQHALAERVLYEKLVNSSYTASVQGLLIGESLNLSPKEYTIVEKHREIFENMGFSFELFPGNIVLIGGVPDFITKSEIANIFEGVIEDIGDMGEIKSLTLDEVRNKIYAYTSCRSAIKFGHKLSLFEMNKLLHDSVIDYSATCPHGRPVVYDIGLHDLQAKYER